MNFVSAWRDAGRRSVLIEPPLRDELLDIERLQDHARALAARFTVDRRRRRRRRLLARLEDNARVLGQTYRLLASDVRARLHVSPAGEWMLDNYHLVLAEIRSLREYLPRRYYAQLPTLAAPDRIGDVRAYALAVELVRHSDSRLDRQQLVAFLTSYQTVAPLTIGELWAWPSMLRLALLENLRRLADEILVVRDARQAADRYVSGLEEGAPFEPPDWPARARTSYVVQLLHRVRDHGPMLQAVQAAIETELQALERSSDDLVREEHQRQATAQVLVANVITSLRVCASLDWRQLFEAVSVVDQVLRRDPAGAYPRMDFHSRDRQRHAVEVLAEPDGDAQVRVALRAVESAREGTASGAARAAHVGYHLIGGGRSRFESTSPSSPPGRSASPAWCAATPPRPTSAASTLATLAALLLADQALRAHDAGARRCAWSPRWSCSCRSAKWRSRWSTGWSRRWPPPTAAPAGFLRRNPGQRTHDGHRADAADERRRRTGAARAARGRGPRQPRPARPLRHSQRRRRCRRPAPARGRRAGPGARSTASRP